VKKKLIEVALPLEASNKAAAREKSVRHGRPSTLHEGTATPLSPPDLLSSTPDRTRTCDLQFRKLPLYPPELRGQDVIQ
jgi:hypothetical protein